MSDLISRSALKKSIEEYRNLNCISTSTIIGVRNIIYLIDNAPTIPLRLMTVEECAGHTIDYAMGWKACIEWIKKGGKE